MAPMDQKKTSYGKLELLLPRSMLRSISMQTVNFLFGVVIGILFISFFSAMAFRVAYVLLWVLVGLELIVILLIKAMAAETSGTVASGRLLTISAGQIREIDGMNLKKGQKLPVILELFDAAGDAATFDGEPVYAISDESLAAFEIGDDGVRYVKHLGAKGAVVVSVEGDADQGEGVKPFRLEGALNLMGGDVVSGELKFGEAVDQ